jgi:hypothetical protein
MSRMPACQAPSRRVQSRSTALRLPVGPSLPDWRPLLTLRRLVLALFFCPFAAHAEPLACLPRTTVIPHLAAKYAERPIAVGLASNGGVVEILSAPSGATWTIVITMPSGATCMVAAGEAWERLAGSCGPRL